MDENSKTFVRYISALDIELSIHPSRAAQITTLQWDKSPIKILVKYADYADIFAFDLAIKLPKNIGINKHAIKLIEEK